MEIPKLQIGSLTADIPIVQGGMGVRVSLASLASAVANEGGIGSERSKIVNCPIVRLFYYVLTIK
ncbi:nitronate monooxygenase [bacterium]|nr:nitronate monooxygenase [bacterium]